MANDLAPQAPAAETRPIRAAVAHAHGQPLKIEEIELRAPLEDEVQVQMGAVAICASDITFLDGKWGGALPAVYGHEAAGEVTAVGASVRGLAPGDRVAVTLIRACGGCPTCASGAPVYCENRGAPRPPALTKDGASITQAMNSGAFAEAVTVHHSQVAKLPATIPYEAAALLACGVITGIGAVVNAAKLRPGEDAVVIGCGGVGLNAIQGARLAGARRIVAVDMMPEKLEAAKEFGATDVVSADQDAPWEAARAILGRGADAVFVATGALPVFSQAPRYLAPLGRVLIVGMPHTGAVASYEPTAMAYDGQSIRGTAMGDTVISRDIPWLADLYLQGRLELDALISRRWSLDEINEAIANSRSGSARRNVITF
ncbi:Zn-dependent alcohol dehydrogenase [Pseudoroseicyclus sp. H15]